MKKKFCLSLAAVAAMIIVAGCGKDKTTDEYQRERLKENLAVYESVAGTYTGNVVSTQTGKSMGALQLDLSAETTTVDQSSGDTTLGSPVLVTNVTYRDQTSLNFRIDSSYYDQDSGAYSASVEVDNNTGANKYSKIVLKGNIRDGRFSGTIGSVNSPNGVGRFDLVLNGTPIDQIRKGAPKGPLDQVGVSADYSGKGTMADSSGKSARRPMAMHVTKPSAGPAGDFVDVFNPERIKRINVSIDISDAVSINFTDIDWDPVNGTVDGYNNNTSGGYTIYLQCSNFYFTSQADKFSCVYWSSRSSRIPMEFGPSDD